MDIRYKVKSCLAWLFPRICCICRLDSYVNIELCWLCKNSLPVIKDRCYQCGLILQAENEHILCAECSYEKPFYDCLHSLYPYETPIDKLILDLKFKKNFINAKVLASLLVPGVQEWYKNKNLPQVVIPMPLHIKRLKQRGFNQVIEFLRPAAKELKISIDSTLCERVVFTRPQAVLNRQHRKTNLKWVFKITKSNAYQHVAIVDDVVTTGSTVAALAAALKKSGVELVDVWCLARA